MFLILGIDGLEKSYVERFNCTHLMQESYGNTDISEFSEPRTIVLWSSFLSGKNQEKRILDLGNIEMWQFNLRPEETFFPKFRDFAAFDVPGYNFSKDQHSVERENLKKFFAKRISREQFDEPVFAHHRKMKETLFAELEKGHGLLMVYFNIADVIGHLSFGLLPKMKLIYRDLDDIAAKASSHGNPTLIISDHGMKAIGEYGDHSSEGFWSLNMKKALGRPKITEFYKFIAKEMR